MRSSKEQAVSLPDLGDKHAHPLPTNIVVNSEVHNIDLNPIAQFTASSFLLGAAGVEPYKLLARLAAQLPRGARVADLGTCEGASAVALASAAQVNVISYDIVDCAHLKCVSVPNVALIKANCLECVKDFLDSVLVHLDIDPHDGVQEQLLLNTLSGLGYRGLLVCDDINLNPGMQQFWASVAQKKLDVTRYGHWSGTGIIVFDPQTIDVEVV